MAQIIFDEFVFVINCVLPSENKLLVSYYESKKMMKNLAMVVKNTCFKECMLYYKETVHLQKWHCKTSRYNLGVYKDGKPKKGVVIRVL